MADVPTTQNVPATQSVPSIAGEGAAAGKMNAADLFNMVNNVSADQDGNLNYDAPYGEDPFAFNNAEGEEEGGGSPEIQPSNPIAQPVVPVVAEVPPQAAIAPPQVPAVPVPDPNAVVQQTPEQIAAQNAAFDAQFTQQLNQLYSVQDDPENPIPESMKKLFVEQATRVHKGTLQHVMALVQQHLPAYIEQTFHQAQTKQKVTSEFFETFPQLNKPEYREMVVRIGKAINENGRNMTEAQRILAIGTTAAMTLNLDPTPAQKSGNPAQSLVPNTPNNPNPTPVVPAQRQNVTPIRGMGGAGGNSSAPATQSKGSVDELFDILSPILRPSSK